MEWSREDFTVSCDPHRVDRSVVAAFLADSYWAKGIPPATVDKAIDGSLCFSLFHGISQIGLARVITDRATIAYIGDVFVLEPFRGKGLGKWLMECVLSHPELQGLRRWILLTRDAHGLYRQFGFSPLAKPERYMELHDPQVYERT